MRFLNSEKGLWGEVTPESFLCPIAATAELPVFQVEELAQAEGSDHTAFLPNESLRCLI